MKKRNMLKKMISLTLALILCIGLLPTTASAAGVYDLWVGGIQVTDSNMNDITAAINTAMPGAARGSASFDPVTNTLTLNGFAYTGEGYAFTSMGDPSAAAVYSKLDTLTVKVINTNRLTHNLQNNYSYGIYTTGDLGITGNSTAILTASGSSTNTESTGIFLYDGELTVNGGTLNGTGGDANAAANSVGIWCFNGDITVNAGAKLTGDGGYGKISDGIACFGKLTVNGGTAEGTTGTGVETSRGITTGSVESSSQNSRIIGTAGNANKSTGIYIWNPSVFSNGYIKGFSNASQSNQSYGMFLDDLLTVDGGTVVAQGAHSAFNRSPEIDSGFSGVGIWHGDTEAEAEAAGAKRKSALLNNYAQKYVRIEYANIPLFDVSVTPASLSLTEGTIHNDPNAKLTASYIGNEDTYLVTSIGYQWHSCDENGNNAIAVNDSENGSRDYEYYISEELAPGTYYYFCKVSGYDSDGNFVASVNTDVVKVEVGVGTPVVIFDPDFGSFAETGSVTIELPISNGKLTGDIPRPVAEGYAFRGWYIKDGELISDPASHTFTHTTRLYADYSKIYTATFDANGGVFSDGTSLYSVEFTDDALDKNKVPADPTKEGCEFLGWYDKDDEGNEHKLELPPGQDYYELIGDFEFYAKWSEDEAAPTPSDDPTPTPTPELDDVPATGDNSQTGFWIGLAMIALAGLCACAVLFCKRKQER